MTQVDDGFLLSCDVFEIAYPGIVAIQINNGVMGEHHTLMGNIDKILHRFDRPALQDCLRIVLIPEAKQEHIIDSIESVLVSRLIGGVNILVELLHIHDINIE
ncbi:hypothetical protein D3C73_1376640 [compost metagenome]